jgi:hypothetical protein
MPVPRRAAWWLIALLLVVDKAASCWLWMLWTERQARREARHAGEPALSRLHAADPSAAPLTQRVR